MVTIEVILIRHRVVDKLAAKVNCGGNDAKKYAQEETGYPNKEEEEAGKINQKSTFCLIAECNQ